MEIYSHSNPPKDEREVAMCLFYFLNKFQVVDFKQHILSHNATVVARTIRTNIPRFAFSISVPLSLGAAYILPCKYGEGDFKIYGL